MTAIEALRRTGIEADVLDHVEEQTVLYARGQSGVATLLTSKGHLYRIRGEQIEIVVLAPAVEIRAKDSAITIRAASGVEAVLFETDVEERNRLLRRLVTTLI